MPESFLLDTVVPIFKGTSVNISDGSNFRGIAFNFIHDKIFVSTKTAVRDAGRLRKNIFTIVLLIESLLFIKRISNYSSIFGYNKTFDKQHY